MTAASVTGALTAKVDATYPLLGRAMARLFAAPDLPTRYPEYLRAMHNVVCATVPLMRECLAELHARPDDPLTPVLLDYFGHHIEEEAGHDDLVLADLAALGLPETFVTDRAPFVEVTALVGAQYYWIRHVHPVVLLGHVYVFEGYPMPASRVDELVDVTGLPPAAFGSLRLHAELDTDHRHDLLALLDGMVLGEKLDACLGLSAMATIRHAAELMETLATMPVRLP
jgi:hypothetical protein